MSKLIKAPDVAESGRRNTNLLQHKEDQDKMIDALE
jgi:hypothetical protein